MTVRIGDIVKSPLLYNDSEFKVTRFDGIVENWIWAECIKSNVRILKIGESLPLEIEEVEVVKSSSVNENMTYQNDVEIGCIVTHTNATKFIGAEFEVVNIVGDNVKVECIKENKSVKLYSKRSFTKNIIEIIYKPAKVTDNFMTSITNNGIKLLRLDRLNDEITKALDNHDKDLFMRLTNEMKDLKRTIDWDLTYAK